ncbi:MAG: cation-translocating P-type ATPase [Actinomycetota bacterium]
MQSNSPLVWHTLEINKSLQQLNSDRDTGLTPQEVEARRERYGLNEIQETGGRSPWAILWDQFKNIMLLMLIGVAVVSGVLNFIDLQAGKLSPGEIPFKDTIAIMSIVILNGILGYLQESRAEKALAALKNLASPLVRVVRGGKITEVSAKELVPGDLILLEAGVQVPADGRLIEESNLQVREAALTGEANAVEKDANSVLAEDAPLGDRANMVFQGTEVVKGRAKALVTATGMQTELGKIAALIQSVEEDETPLQQRMGQLGNVLVTGSLILVAVVVIGGMIQSGWNLNRFRNLLEVSLSMAVAVVPEGLPAVITVTLALGTQRMVKRNALIRKLPAVETLGSVTTICSDKTGTLTQNKMVVQLANTASHSIGVTGEGYAPIGSFSDRKATASIGNLERYPELESLLVSCAICNDAVLQQDKNEWTILGDPTEGALLSFAGKAGIYREQQTAQLPRIAEFPFSSERKRMSVICQLSESGRQWAVPIASQEAHYLMFTKGSPELILERCSSLVVAHNLEPLTEEQRRRILQENNEMAANGLRVLGFAYKPWDSLPPENSEETSEQDMVWLGLIGMLDAPRPEVREAVRKCREAGIRPVMITGDHQLTARAIACDLGIAREDEIVLTGQELEKLTQDQLREQVEQVSVYARVSPEHKLRIVQALQSLGKFVAMTGDGVNDAPALKQADIGIAMGITGTDVSKEASDMVLLDDNFATIVKAVEEGRVVYTNIRRFIKYILGSNIGEVLTIAAAPIIGLGDVPLTPLQILWMNLVTDGVPALALAVEPAEPNVMKRKPFSPRESIFARGLGSYMIRIGIIFAILTIALMVWSYNWTHAPGYEGEREAWKTMVFTTLCLAQMGHAIAIRSNTQLTVELNPFTNPYVWGAVIVTTALQLMLIYIPPLRAFFGTHVLTLPELGICLGFSALMFVWIELEKLFIRFYQKSRR